MKQKQKKKTKKISDEEIVKETDTNERHIAGTGVRVPCNGNFQGSPIWSVSSPEVFIQEGVGSKPSNSKVKCKFSLRSVNLHWEGD